MQIIEMCFSVGIKSIKGFEEKKCNKQDFTMLYLSSLNP